MTTETKTKIQDTIQAIIEEQFKKHHNMEDAVIYAGRWAAGRMKHVAPQERQAWRVSVAEAGRYMNKHLKDLLMEPIRV